MYESLSVQKTSAALLSAVVCTFHPSLVLQSLEVDSYGFDLFFFAQIELSSPLIQLIQEELRRKKSKAIIRSFTMMPDVLKAFALKEKKQIGPENWFADVSVVDVCQIDSYCCVVDGPHEETIEPGTEITLAGSSSIKGDHGWLWHIRGYTSCTKKQAKLVRNAQRYLWEHPAKEALEKSGLVSFVHDDMIFLPSGVNRKKELLQELSFGSQQWIEFSCSEQVVSDEDLVLRMLDRAKELRSHMSLKGLIFEDVRTSWPQQARMPLGCLEMQSALIGYFFNCDDDLDSYLSQIFSFLQEKQRPLHVQLVCSRESVLTLMRTKIEKVPVQYANYPGLGSKAIFFFQLQHGDGRFIPLSALVVDSKSNVPVMYIPAISIERWIGFFTELNGMGALLREIHKIDEVEKS